MLQDKQPAGSDLMTSEFRKEVDLLRNKMLFEQTRRHEGISDISSASKSPLPLAVFTFVDPSIISLLL